MKPRRTVRPVPAPLPLFPHGAVLAFLAAAVLGGQEMRCWWK